MISFPYLGRRRAGRRSEAGLVAAVTVAAGLTGVPGVSVGAAVTGAKWSVEPTPNAVIANGSLAADVCVSAGWCVAVGSYESRLGTSALAEVWNGTDWHIRAVPVPPGGTRSALDGVSCTTASSCIAVGHYISNQGVKVTLAERWNGTSWSLQPTPDPAGAKDSVLSGVSCGSATSCVAVGRTYYGRNQLARLVEQWNGTAWSIKQASNPRNAALSALSGVSCVASTACVAVGNYLDYSSDDWLTLAEAWNGSTWTVTPSPNPAKSIVNNLSGVSCTTPTSCTAVGHYENQANMDVKLVEQYSG